MNQKHVPSLELCQEFNTLCKEKGIVVPETEFYWVESTLDGKVYLETNTMAVYGESIKKLFPAPLVSEQGEWLPPAIKVKDALAYLKYVPHSDKQTDVIYSKVGWFHQESDYKEANARQKMINYLIAEGIITTL